jgi:CRISPR-associated endonuclease/helicase Cas3
MSYPVDKKSMIGHDDNLLSLLSLNSTTINDYIRTHNSAPEIDFTQSFMSAAKSFRAIDSQTRGVIVPFGKGEWIIGELCSADGIGKTYELLHEAQRYSVNIFPYQWMELYGQHLIHEVREGTGIYYLVTGYYDSDIGLSMIPTVNSPVLYVEEGNYHA